MASTINAKTTGVGGIDASGDASGVLALQTGGTTAVTIDASQNVGIGTGSPNALLHVSNVVAKIRIGETASSAYLDISRDGATGYSIYNAAQADPYRGHVWQLGGTEAMRIDTAGLLKFNSGYGSVATAYGCRAWVNFNGTGTVAIRASGNVSSITDVGVGNYTVNFTTAMPDANFIAEALGTDGTGGAGGADAKQFEYRSATTTTFNCVYARQYSPYSVADCTVGCIAIFR